MVSYQHLIALTLAWIFTHITKASNMTLTISNVTTSDSLLALLQDPVQSSRRLRVQATIDCRPEVPDFGCSICGEGLCVQNPDAIISFPGSTPVACGEIESQGYTGLIPLDQCIFLPSLLNETCSCGRVGTFAPTPPPTVLTAKYQCIATPMGGCSVCGEGLCVQNPDDIFSFPGLPLVACGDLERQGYAGLIPGIPIRFCPVLPLLIAETCYCGTLGTLAPTPLPTASSAPALSPTRNHRNRRGKSKSMNVVHRRNRRGGKSK